MSLKIYKFFLRITPKIFKIKRGSKELRLACKFYQLNCEEVLSKYFSSILIALILTPFLIIFLKLVSIPILLILYVYPFFLSEYPKILYHRKMAEEFEELPYFLSALSASYSTTHNFEKSFEDCRKFFSENSIIAKLHKEISKRKEEGRERILIDDPDLAPYFDFINLSFKAGRRRKSEVIKEGFRIFMERVRKEKIKGIGKLYFQIVLLFLCSCVVPLILISSYPVIFLIVKGATKYLILLIFFIVVGFLSLVLSSNLKHEARQITEKIEKRGKFNKTLLVIPIAISFPSILFSFSYFGIFVKIKILDLIGLDFIPISFSILIFLYLNSKYRPALRVEKKVKEENEKLITFLQGMESYLKMGMSPELALRKVLEEENLNTEKIESKNFSIALKRILDFREKGKEVITSFCRTFREILRTIGEVKEEIIKKVYSIANSLKFTAIFILPFLGALVIKISFMIFSVYHKSYSMIREVQLPIFFPSIGTAMEKKEMYLLSLLLHFYIIFISYLMLDLATYLEKGEVPSSKIEVGKGVLITSLLFTIITIALRGVG